MQTREYQIDWALVRLTCKMFRLSFRQLAALSGYTRSYLYQMERTGKNGPRVPEVLAEVLGVPVHAILTKEKVDGEVEWFDPESEPVE